MYDPRLIGVIFLYDLYVWSTVARKTQRTLLARLSTHRRVSPTRVRFPVKKDTTVMGVDIKVATKKILAKKQFRIYILMSILTLTDYLKNDMSIMIGWRYLIDRPGDDVLQQNMLSNTKQQVYQSRNIKVKNLNN